MNDLQKLIDNPELLSQEDKHGLIKLKKYIDSNPIEKLGKKYNSLQEILEDPHTIKCQIFYKKLCELIEKNKI